jgi:hypothetical protein
MTHREAAMTNQKTLPPAFTQAMRQYERIAAQHGEDSKQAINAFTQAMLKAPDWFRDEAHDMAEQMGLIPDQPSGYSDDGQALYSLQDIATHMGISLDEAEQHLHGLMEQRKAAGLDNSGVVVSDHTRFNRRQ